MFGKRYLIEVTELDLRVLVRLFNDNELYKQKAMNEFDEAFVKGDKEQYTMLGTKASGYADRIWGLQHACDLLGIHVEREHGRGQYKIDMSKLHECKDMLTVMRENWDK